MKYIVIDHGTGGLQLPTPFVFPETSQHVDVAFAFRKLYELQGYVEPFKVISAGFCTYREKEGWICWGKSTSLEVESRTEKDSKLFNRIFRVEA